jgi:hypothetical protein
VRKLLFIAALLFSNPVLSDPWHGWTKITTLYPYSGGYIFMVESPLTEFSSCDNGRRFSIALGHQNYDAMVSSLLLAFASDYAIRVNLDARSGPTCQPTINRFMVLK